MAGVGAAVGAGVGSMTRDGSGAEDGDWVRTDSKAWNGSGEGSGSRGGEEDGGGLIWEFEIVFGATIGCQEIRGKGPTGFAVFPPPLTRRFFWMMGFR